MMTSYNVEVRTRAGRLMLATRITRYATRYSAPSVHFPWTCLRNEAMRKPSKQIRRLPDQSDQRIQLSDRHCSDLIRCKCVALRRGQRADLRRRQPGD